MDCAHPGCDQLEEIMFPALQQGYCFDHFQEGYTQNSRSSFSKPLSERLFARFINITPEPSPIPKLIASSTDMPVNLESMHCDIKDCDRVATWIEVGEAGDIWMCEIHKKRRAYIHAHGAFQQSCSELCGWYFCQRDPDDLRD